MFKLFIDDVRNPPDKTWTVAKSFKEAKLLFDLHGWPHVVSFDHDLGPDKTGYDFAKFLVEVDLDTNTMPDDFKFVVHSSNPVGKQNIEILLTNYIEQKKDNLETLQDNTQII